MAAVPKQIMNALVISLAAFSAAAHAEENRWFAHVGAAKITFDERVDFSLAGTAAPEASAKVPNNSALVIDLGYRFTPEWSTSVTFGTPPTSKPVGTGAAQSFGKLGEIKYGPAVFSAQYSFTSFKSVRPYLGAGAVYYIVLDTKDGAVQQLKASSGWGYGVQAGLEFPLSERYSLFFDVKKLFVDTKTTGVLPALGGAPVSADIKLDPLLFHAGFSVSF